MSVETRAKDARVFPVAQHPFCRGLNHMHMGLLADSGLTSRFRAGQTIFRDRERADRFYLIETEKIVLESGKNGGPVIIETIGAGDLLGW